MSNIIALCGPDGTGKSTLANATKKHGFLVEYGGKKSNHRLFFTMPVLSIYHILKNNRMDRAAYLYLNIVFYPVEYIENILRVLDASEACKNGNNVIFDRFVIDRIWRSYLETDYVFPASLLVSFFNFIYAYIYMNAFPKIDGYVFLLPPSDVIIERQPNDYDSFQDCENIRSAYYKVAKELENQGENVLIIESDLDMATTECRFIEWFNSI